MVITTCHTKSHLTSRLEQLAGDDDHVKQKIYSWNENVDMLNNKRDDYTRRISSIQVLILLYNL